MATYTITFGDQAENHAGMQKIGEEAEEGFELEDLIAMKVQLEDLGVKCRIIYLNPYMGEVEGSSEVEDAYVLVAENALDKLVDGGSDAFMEEQRILEKDSKAFMYGRVVNKKARHNLCFGEEDQEPDYQAGKGRIVAFRRVRLLSELKEKWYGLLGEKAEGLVAEGNYYYDVNKCFIGYHGDGERRKVIGVRVGESFPFYYQWFRKSAPVGGRVEIRLGHGDVYVMTSKAVGTDWKLRSRLTLRHCAGFAKVLKLEGESVDVVDLNK